MQSGPRSPPARARALHPCIAGLTLGSLGAWLEASPDPQCLRLSRRGAGERLAKAARLGDLLPSRPPHPQGLAKSCQVQSGASIEDAREGVGTQPLASDLATGRRLSPSRSLGEIPSQDGSGSPPSRVGWGREWQPAAGSSASLRGHRPAHQGGRAQAVTRGAGTGVLESGSPFPPQGAVAAGRLRGEVTATGLAATWLGQLGGCRSGEPGGPLPYPVPCPVARGASSRIWGQQPQPYLPAPGPPVGQDGGGGGGDPCPQASGGVVAGLGLAPKRFRLIRASWPVDPWLLPAPRWRPPHRPGDPCTPRPSQPRLLPT